jgi:hypothetical protein
MSLATADDDLLLDRGEVAVFFNITPMGVSNGVTAGRLPRPIRIGGGRRGLPRWRLGDLRETVRKSQGYVA